MGCHAAAAAAGAAVVLVVVVVVMMSRGSKLHYAVGGLKFHFTGRLTGHNSCAELAEFQTWHLSNSSHTVNLLSVGFVLLQNTCSTPGSSLKIYYRFRMG